MNLPLMDYEQKAKTNPYKNHSKGCHSYRTRARRKDHPSNRRENTYKAGEGNGFYLQQVAKAVPLLVAPSTTNAIR